MSEIKRNVEKIGQQLRRRSVICHAPALVPGTLKRNIGGENPTSLFLPGFRSGRLCWFNYVAKEDQ